MLHEEIEISKKKKKNLKYMKPCFIDPWDLQTLNGQQAAFDQNNYQRLRCSKVFKDFILH